MKILKFIMLALMLGMAFSHAEAKHVKVPHMYMFGFSASFNDSTLYLTDIQDLANAWYDTKTKFLMGRDSYSYQLKEYFEAQGQPGRVCLVMYATTKKKAEKLYRKLKKKYADKSGHISGLQYLTSSDFKFNAVDVAEE